MVEFKILVDLVAAADTSVEARDSLDHCGFDFGGCCIEDVDREDIPEGLRAGLSGTQWDITLESTVEAETPEVAAATALDRDALDKFDPEWHCLVFEGDDEVLELGGEPHDEPSTWKRFTIVIDITEDYISHRDHPSLKPSQRCAVNPDGKFSGAEDWLLAQINNAILADGVVYLASFEEVTDHPTEEELRKYD